MPTDLGFRRSLAYSNDEQKKSLKAAGYSLQYREATIYQPSPSSRIYATARLQESYQIFWEMPSSPEMPPNDYNEFLRVVCLSEGAVGLVWFLKSYGVDIMANDGLWMDL